VTPASRNVWLEAAAFGLFLISLPAFLVAGYCTAMYIVNGLLPHAQPIVLHGVTFGRSEALVTALSTSIPGASLIAAAWGLRLLLVEEGEAEELNAQERLSTPKNLDAGPGVNP
jgi:hypothetical protein